MTYRRVTKLSPVPVVDLEHLVVVIYISLLDNTGTLKLIKPINYLVQIKKVMTK